MEFHIQLFSSITGTFLPVDDTLVNVDNLNKQLNERQGFKDGLVKQVKDLQDKVSDLDSRVDDLENP